MPRTGKRVLLLERGDYLPRERGNWDSEVVFGQGRYTANETFLDIDDGAALFRLARHDFDDVAHPKGIAPAWPIS